MKRKTTPYEKQLIELYCVNWSYDSEYVYDDMIHLGNGFDENITALLPIECLYKEFMIQKDHVILVKDDNPVPQLNITLLNEFLNSVWGIRSRESYNCKTALKEFIEWYNIEKGLTTDNENPNLCSCDDYRCIKSDFKDLNCDYISLECKKGL